MFRLLTATTATAGLTTTLETALSYWPLTLALWAEIAGSFALVLYVIQAVLVLLRGPKPHRVELARITLADGVIFALGFKMSAALLKTVALQTWEQIGLFAATVILRTLLKRYFVWEKELLKARMGK